MPHNVEFSANDRATRKRFVLIPFLILLALAAWGWISLRQLSDLRLTTTRSGNDVRVSPHSDQPFMVTHLAVMGAAGEASVFPAVFTSFWVNPPGIPETCVILRATRVRVLIVGEEDED